MKRSVVGVVLGLVMASNGWLWAAPPRDTSDKKTGTIAGKVVDEGGKPVAGAKVTLYSPPRKDRPQQVLATALTDKEGRFTLGRVSPSKGYVIAAEGTDSAWGSKGDISVTAGKSTDLGTLKIVVRPRM